MPAHPFSSSSPGELAARGPSARLEAWGFFFLAFAWRLGAALQIHNYVLDEANFGVPTVREVMAGYWPLHPSRVAYGFPLNEWLAAPLFLFFGPNPLWLRLPNLLMAAAAIAWFYVQLRRHFGRPLACLVTLLVACPHGLHLTFVALGSGYGMVLLSIALANHLLERLPLRASPRRFAVGGAIMGWVHFAVPHIGIFLLAWTLIQLGPHLVRLGRRLLGTRQGRYACAVFVAGAALVGAAGYHFLTRRIGYQMSPRYAALWISGATLLAGVGGFVWWRHSFWRAVTRRWAAFLVLMIVSALPLNFAYAHWQRAHHEQTQLHNAARYSLKHAHQWPRQVAFFAAKIVPLAFVAPTSTLDREMVEDTAVAPGAVAAGALLLAGWIGAVRAMSRGRDAARRGCLALWLVPVGLTAALMVPSWSLAHDIHARYFSLVVVGLWLPVAFLLLALRSRALRALLVGALLAWNAYDAFVLWPAYWNPQARTYDELR